MVNLSKTNWLTIVLVIAICIAGIFVYQWWQMKGELVKQIEQNENLTKQVDKLQVEIDKLKKEIEELKIAEEIKDETAKGGCLKSEQECLVLISPNGGEVWQEGKSYNIKWDQRGLDYWGDVATICLQGFDSTGETILPKDSNTDLCSIYGESLKIEEPTLSLGEYRWTVSPDVSAMFKESPKFYKIQVMVFDHLPPEGRSEWAGRIAENDSDDFFSITE